MERYNLIEGEFRLSCPLLHGRITKSNLKKYVCMYLGWILVTNSNISRPFPPASSRFFVSSTGLIYMKQVSRSGYIQTWRRQGPDPGVPCTVSSVEDQASKRKSDSSSLFAPPPPSPIPVTSIVDIYLDQFIRFV